LELPLRHATHYPFYGLAALQHNAHVEAAAHRNVSVFLWKFQAKKSIVDTLSILLSKSIADNTVDNRKVAAIIATSILTSLSSTDNRQYTLHAYNTRYMPVWWAPLFICILKQIISEILWQCVVSQQLFLFWML